MLLNNQFELNGPYIILDPFFIIIIGTVASAGIRWLSGLSLKNAEFEMIAFLSLPFALCLPSYPLVAPFHQHRFCVFPFPSMAPFPPVTPLPLLHDFGS